MSNLPEAKSMDELLLKAIAEGTKDNLPEARSRLQVYLKYIAMNANGNYDQIERAVNEYLDANPVTAGATKEQAEQIQQNTTTIGELKEDLGGCIRYNSKSEKQEQEETKIVFNNVGKRLNDDGAVVDSVSFSTTDFIDITDAYGVYRTGSTTKFSMWYYAFYDENKNFLSFRSDGTNYDIVDYGDKKVTWLTLNTSAKYIRITMETSRDFYSYYSVKNKSVIESYDVPMLTFNGEDILTEAKTAVQASTKINSITEYVIGNNIFDPSLLKTTNYYYDFADGTTHISRSGTKLTEDFVELPQDTNFVCIRQKSQVPESTMILVYCYNDTTYLGYTFRTVGDIGTNSYVYYLKTGTTKIKLYISSASFEGTDICISKKELELFESYKLNLVVKKEASHNYDGFFSLKGKKIVNFGDSIFGVKRPPHDISTALAELTGATVYNCGFGGCRMSTHDANFDPFSMYRLADAIVTGDFTLQDSVNVDGSVVPTYFRYTRSLLKNIDFDDVDIITIAYGTNDFTADIPLDGADKKSISTFAGALRYSIERILEKYPHIKIYICGQTYRFWMDSSHVFTDDSDTRLNSNGVKLTDFVDKTRDVAKEYHLKFIDNYYDLGINKYNRSHWFSATDGTHQNALGSVIIAEHMASEMF